MPKKPKFRPVITRVKLNPEQAVLACNCWTAGHTNSGTKTSVGVSSDICSGSGGPNRVTVKSSWCGNRGGGTGNGSDGAVS
jgi:hypothetical protein